MKKFFLALLATATALAIAPKASATEETYMFLSSGASTSTIESSGTGVTVFSGSVGSWNLNGTFGYGPPANTTLDPILDMSTLDAATVAPPTAPITITLVEEGLTSPLGTLPAVVQINGNSSYTSTVVTTQAFLSTIDIYCDVAGPNCLALTGLDTATGTGGTGFGGTATGSAATGGGPYAITLVATINPGDNEDTTSFDDSLSIAPEPSSLLLFGTGLLGLAFVAFRKAKSSGATLSM